MIIIVLQDSIELLKDGKEKSEGRSQTVAYHAKG